MRIDLYIIMMRSEKMGTTVRKLDAHAAVLKQNSNSGAIRIYRKSFEVDTDTVDNLSTCYWD